MKTIGEKIDPILQEIETALWEFEVYDTGKPCYPENSLKAATKIFMSVLMDKMYDLQDNENFIMNDRINMAIKAGEDIRKLVKIYTNIDTYDFYKKKED
jgi:hypothetical protein